MTLLEVGHLQLEAVERWEFVRDVEQAMVVEQAEKQWVETAVSEGSGVPEFSDVEMWSGVEDWRPELGLRKQLNVWVPPG